MIKSLRKLMLAFVGCVSLMLSGCEQVKTFDAKLNFNEVTMDVESTKQLEIQSVTYKGLELPPNQYSYIWTSSDVSVARVNSRGLVTGISAGTCEVKANFTITGNPNNPLIVKCLFTITDPNPVTIELSKNEASVQAGKTLQLTANVDHAVNKEVLWSSNSQDITVSNSGLVSVKETAVIGSKGIITAKSKEDSNAKATCEITVIEPSTKSLDYTIMLYMCASTLEYEAGGGYRAGTTYPGLFSEDIKEILSVDLPDSVKVIIETGGTKKWGLKSTYIDGATSISNASLQRWEVCDHKLKLIETLGTNHMAEEASYESFLEWGISNYDADQIGVVISGHGAGIGGCAVDDNYTYYYGGYTFEHMLNCEEIATATKDALAATGHSKLTWMGFDCCLMQSGDIASVLADYFDYMVASQESEFGEGWDHDSYMQLIVDNTRVTPEVLLPEICKSFVEAGHDGYCTNSEPCLQTLSVLDLTKMSAFTNAFNDYVLETGYTKTELSKYETAFKKAYNAFGEGCYGLVDFRDYMNKLSTQFTSVSNASVLAALDNLVMSNHYCSRYTTEPCGLNAFFPASTTREELQPGKSDYSSDLSTKFTNYRDMCLLSSNWEW